MGIWRGAIADDVSKLKAMQSFFLFLHELSVHECFILPIKQKIQDKTQTKQLCCLIFFLQLFSATCRCLLCTLWLLPHHFSCLQLSSVLFWGALSSQRVSEGCSVLESVREQNRSTDFFGWSFGGYLQTPLQFYAG